MSTATATIDEDLDIGLIEDEIIKEQNRSAHVRKVGKQKIKVRSSVEKAKDDYKQAKATHNAAIERLKNDIRRHKLLKKQAKNTYKLIKLSNK